MELVKNRVQRRCLIGAMLSIGFGNFFVSSDALYHVLVEMINLILFRKISRR